MLVPEAGPIQVLEEDSLPDLEEVFTKVLAGERIEVLAVEHTKVQGGHARPDRAEAIAIRGTGRRLHVNKLEAQMSLFLAILSAINTSTLS